MVNWKKLARRIPDRIQVGTKSYYEVLWSDNVEGKGHFGVTDPNKKQIKIQTNLTPKVAVLTFLHECIHAVNFEYEIGLTESQTELIENKVLYYLLKEGNIFKK